MFLQWTVRLWWFQDKIPPSQFNWTYVHAFGAASNQDVWRDLQLRYWNWAKKYMFYKTHRRQSVVTPSRVSKVEFQSFILKTEAGRAIETICETTLFYSKTKRVLDNRKEGSITVQRVGCELDDQEFGIWFSAVAISSFPQHPHRLLDTFSFDILSSSPAG